MILSAISCSIEGIQTEGKSLLSANLLYRLWLLLHVMIDEMRASHNNHTG